jgi:RNA polymerase sigma-70 factor (ECF subfamily)
MDEQEWLVEQFETYRRHLRKVAYRMLGSVNEADDAVQESWLRISRVGAGGVENFGGWLTTIIGRVCLDMLRARRLRREEPLDTTELEPTSSVDTVDLERDAMLADSVGQALLLILDKLVPAERIAYVLHDMFDLPFDEIGPIIRRSTEAARQLASRARRRVRGGGKVPNADRIRQREVVEAFLAASRNGDFDALIAALDADVVIRSDRVASLGGVAREVRGATAIARGALNFSVRAASTRPVLVDGAIGLAWYRDGRLAGVLDFVCDGGKIVEIEIIGDPERLGRLDLAELDGFRIAMRY